jgi:hypothetical protein
MHIQYLKLFNSIKESEKNDFGYSVESHKQRGLLVKKFAWAIPNEEAIELICKYSPIVEIGAGTGYWASLIKSNKGKIICFDKHNDGGNSYGHTFHHYNVYNGNESILHRMHHSMNLFLCWPPYDDDMAFNCIKTFKGKYLIYIGENSYGCTGNKAFFNELRSNWKRIDSIDIPKWPGLYDCLTIYKRNKMIAWKVYLNNKLINTVYFDESCNKDYIKKSLIEHDGMP